MDNYTWDYNNSIKNSFIDKYFIKAYISKDQGVLCLIDNNQQKYFYEAYGDCCSETWFSDIIGLHSLLDSKIIEAKYLALPNYNVDDGRGRQDFDEVYGLQFVTEKGTCDIIFRNSSNGYYGGELNLILEFPQEEELELKEITEDDWAA